jgi:hypothetical protein
MAYSDIMASSACPFYRFSVSWKGQATYFGRVFHALFFGLFLSRNYLLDLSYFSVIETPLHKREEDDYLAFAAASSDLRKDSITNLNGVASFVLDLVRHFDSEGVGTWFYER